MEIVKQRQVVKGDNPSEGFDGDEMTDRFSARNLFPVRRENKKELICLGTLLLIWLIVWIPRLRGPIDFRWDASTYYVLGTSLAEGKGYRLLNEPGEIEAVQYPPLLPLIVAAHQRVMGTSDYFKIGSALRLSYFLLSGLYLLAVYTLARQVVKPLFALLVATITALSFYSFLHPSDTLYAEVPFALVSVLFLLCHRNSDRPLYFTATAVFGGAAYLLRTAGIALLAAWIAESLIRRRFRQAAMRAAVAAIPILAWQVHVWRVTASADYHRVTYAYQRAPYYYSNVTYGENSWLVDPFRPELGQTTFGGLTGRIVRNLVAVPLALGESAFFPTSYWPAFLDKLHHGLHVPESRAWRTLSSRALSGFLFAAGLLATAGAVIVARRRQWFWALYFAITLGTIVLTPWQSQFWRYLAPVTPLTLIFMVVALLTVRRLLAGRYPRLPNAATASVVAAPVTAILALEAGAAIPLLRNMLPVSYYDDVGRERQLPHFTYGTNWHSLDYAFQWVRRHASPGSVIATTVPQLAYLRTGLKAVLPPFEPDSFTANRLLDEVPVSYLILDDLGVPGISERYAAPVVAGEPNNWRLVFSAPDAKTRVYERIR
jgi:hypothetical protein